MNEHIKQINHLAEVLYNESLNCDVMSRSQARLYQDLIDELQNHVDSIANELLERDGAI